MPDGMGAALQESSTKPATSADATTASCPLARYAVEVLVQGTDGKPVEGIVVQLAKSKQEAAAQITAGDAAVRFDGLTSGSYTLALPAFDKDAWKLLRTEDLAAEAQTSSGDMGWSSPYQDAAGKSTHEVAPGDCLSNIAFLNGFAPDTVWQDGANSDLRSQRKSQHILLPGDIVAIPEKRSKEIPASTGKRYVLELVAVPEILRIRFLTYAQKPRAGVPYLLQIVTSDGVPVPDREGETDAEGYVTESIPPNAISGELWLGKGVNMEEIPIRLGYVNPIDDLRGVQSRLNALNYVCGDEDGTLGDKTREALRNFQLEHQLPVTGEPDQTTLDKLEAMFLS
jgi:hypothetical protein